MKWAGINVLVFSQSTKVVQSDGPCSSEIQTQTERWPGLFGHWFCSLEPQLNLLLRSNLSSKHISYCRLSVRVQLELCFSAFALFVLMCLCCFILTCRSCWSPLIALKCDIKINVTLTKFWQEKHQLTSIHVLQKVISSTEHLAKMALSKVVWWRPHCLFIFYFFLR